LVKKRRAKTEGRKMTIRLLDEDEAMRYKFVAEMAKGARDLLKGIDKIMKSEYSPIGYLFYQIGYTQDLMWNIYGEAIEDVTTAKEDTLFGKKNVTVSTSIGKEEIDNKLVPSGKKISKVLNVAFNQKQHAMDFCFMK